ncbi:amidohydrolase family protein [Methylobrevis albus]|uniref:2-amino-3-carboxymuconate-6-semialdehyde decarboxylase n=1 Tax=Methylobrevis albus TaxID=2793297 RepID=A0A931MZ96_9HYPH|nr:amidohydrolase family protein [Methylobrevis albus]MBH0238810.1 amidohydrolase [Methylobrevis albus]
MPGKPLVIDTHTHFVPKSAIEPASRGELWNGIQFGRNARGKITSTVGAVSQEIPWPTPLETPEARLGSMDARRVDVHILSISPTLYWYGLSSADAVTFSRTTNDDLAELVASQPDRFAGLGYLPLQDTAASVAELERCVRDLGFPGVMIGTNVNGANWDEESLYPVLSAAAELGAVLYFHPARGRADSWLKRYHFSNLIGNPLETAVCLGSLIFGGIFDKLPTLKTCFAHAGGYGVLGVGRLDHGQEVRPEATGLAKLPSDYVRACWFDTITHNERALRYLVDMVGPGQVVLGSDYPADMGEPYPVDFVEGCASLSADEQSAILGSNAADLFSISQREPLRKIG